jgi:hypothetical protein
VTPVIAPTTPATVLARPIHGHEPNGPEVETNDADAELIRTVLPLNALRDRDRSRHLSRRPYGCRHRPEHHVLISVNLPYSPA